MRSLAILLAVASMQRITTTEEMNGCVASGGSIVETSTGAARAAGCESRDGQTYANGDCGPNSQQEPPRPPPSTKSALAEIAASLSPGEWGELQVPAPAGGWNAMFTEATSGSVLAYADSAGWDVVTRKLFFTGSKKDVCHFFVQEILYIGAIYER